MALALDGFALLRRIGAQDGPLADDAAAINRAAQQLATVLMRARAADIAALRRLRETLGAADFDLVLDAVSDAEIGRLLAKLDPHRSAGPDAGGRRGHLHALAACRADPASPAEAPADATPLPTTPAAAAPTQPSRLHSAAMAAVRHKGKKDAPRKAGKKKKKRGAD